VPHPEPLSGLSVRRAASGGFTLLEVLVAVAILGLGLTVVLSAQTGVFFSYSRATKLSQAPGLLRCKMEEVELDLLKDGYPLLDEQDDGECCEDLEIEGYTCSWKIEKVELPELNLGTGFGDAGTGTTSEEGEGEDLGGGGPLGALAGLQAGGPEAMTQGGGLGDLAGMMSTSGGGQGLASMVMSLVYPDLKPMLESSIRKVSVSVRWQEGLRQRDLSVVQFVTSPQQGGFDPMAAEGVDQAADQALDAIDQLMGGGNAP
jgi:general secretion pathway protein I